MAARQLLRRLARLLGGLWRGLRLAVNLLFLLLAAALLFGWWGDRLRPLPAQAPLHLAIEGQLVEERTLPDPLALLGAADPASAETVVREVVEAVDAAREDPRITGLVLDLDRFAGAPLARLAEVGQALARFRASGKPLWAYGGTYSQAGYYLASFAERIATDPMGGVLITGFGTYGLYLGEALERLRVRIHSFQAGRYKSAVEPFTRDGMSAEARENATAWVTALWREYTATVEANRRLPPGTLDRLAREAAQGLAAHGGDLAAWARAEGLVDAVEPRAAFEAAAARRFGERDGRPRWVELSHYLAHQRRGAAGEAATGEAPPGKTGRIGLIVAAGPILEGEQPPGTIGAETLAALLRRAREDETLAALVLRIDSPGGSALAAEVVRRELAAVREKMPVVVSMGALAASGGYWLATAADEIWASPTTLTGSIGVFGILPTLEESLAALGIHSDGVGTGPLAGFPDLTRPLSPAARALLDLQVQHLYRRFLALVAEARGLPLERVAEVAEGRVWTGREAADLGLVDGVGGLREAVAAAAARAGLARFQLVPLARPSHWAERLLALWRGGAATAGLFPAPLAHWSTALRRGGQPLLYCLPCAAL
ncbi:MAG: protease 4 [Porticoccaceae bacterium]|nr:MAG: protease 4 [Porticoccaceae bacterium]